MLCAGASGAAAKEKARSIAEMEAAALLPSPILTMRIGKAAQAKVEAQKAAPQAKFFTINGVLAKLEGRDLSAAPVRLARADPREAIVMSDVAVPLSSSARSLEPFGLFAFRAPEGELWTKWRGVEAAMKREAEALAKCRMAISDCSSTALSFALMTQVASAYDGKARLVEVNRAVNRAIRYTSDIAQYGVLDYWSAPFDALASGRGDCEDYAIAKYAILREAGVSPDSMRLILLRDNLRREDHAVLAVLEAGEWIVLDNHLENPARADLLTHYAPLYEISQNGVQLFATPYAQTRTVPLAAVPAADTRREADVLIGGIVTDPFAWMMAFPLI
jgi:predicted transglutaminase-like cysteine proteinase